MNDTSAPYTMAHKSPWITNPPGTKRLTIYGTMSTHMPFTTKLKSPRVITLMGRVIILSMGRMSMFTRANTILTTIATG